MANGSIFSAATRGVSAAEKGISLAPFTLAGFPAIFAPAKANWEFAIIAGVTKKTVNHFGGLRKVRKLIRRQLRTVNQRFNQPNVFVQPFRFAATSIYEFSGNVDAELAKAHPSHAYRMVYNGFPTKGGGWLGSLQAIHHSWSVTHLGGPFGSQATDGLVHEFGHARGAIDFYALEVDAAKNPVNSQDFRTVASIMNYPYGVTTWDDHSVHLINANADTVAPAITYITKAFPPRFLIQTSDPRGKRLAGTEIKLHPVAWYSRAVTATPVFSGRTNAQGEVALPKNPFDPGRSGVPWDIRYCNFLIAARHKTGTTYKWLPLNEVQNHHFNNPGQPFIAIITI